MAILAAAVLLLTQPPAEASAARTIAVSGEPLTQRLVSDLASFCRRETPKAPRFSIVGGGTAGGIVDGGLVSRAPATGEPRNPVATRSRPARSAISTSIQYTASLHVVAYEGIPCTRATIVAGTYRRAARSASSPAASRRVT